MKLQLKATRQSYSQKTWNADSYALFEWVWWDLSSGSDAHTEVRTIFIFASATFLGVPHRPYCREPRKRKGKCFATYLSSSPHSLYPWTFLLWSQMRPGGGGAHSLLWPVVSRAHTYRVLWTLSSTTAGTPSSTSITPWRASTASRRSTAAYQRSVISNNMAATWPIEYKASAREEIEEEICHKGQVRGSGGRGGHQKPIAS